MPSSVPGYDRDSTVEVNEDQQQIIVKPARKGHGTDDEIQAALKNQAHEHAWVQRGNYLHCEGGGAGYPHGVAINVHDRYVGNDETGKPLFEKIDVDKLTKQPHNPK